MRYGSVNEVIVFDSCDAQGNQQVNVRVEFAVDRCVLFEFMDAIKPIDTRAIREPIEAILDNSFREGEQPPALWPPGSMPTVSYKTATEPPWTVTCQEESEGRA